MKQALLAVLVLSCSSLLYAATSGGNFAGVYKCTGRDPYLNKNYSGIVTISPQNTVYQLDMRYDTGEVARGTGGLYNSELLSVVFQDTTDLNKVGLEQYRWSKDRKKMGGYWVYLGKDKLGTEVCEKQNSKQLSKN